MPDIALCANPERCEKHDECYRAKAQPGQLQNYSMLWQDGVDCVFFIEVCRDEV